MYLDYYKKFPKYLEVFLRYFSAFILFFFGFSKLLPLQFVFDNPLTEVPFKYLEGTDMVWSFFGYSYYYTFFPGFIQVIGSLMLLFRSTKLLGSMILIPVLVNIFMLNIFYGPPIFFLSGLLLFSCFYIVFMDRELIINFIRENELFSFEKQSSSNLNPIIKTLIRIFIIGLPFYMNYSSYTSKNINKVSDFNGEWIVNSYKFKSNSLCPDYSWKRIIWDNNSLTLYTNYKKFSGKYLITKNNNISISFDNKEKDILDISGIYNFSSDHKKMFMFLNNQQGNLQIEFKQGNVLKAY